MYGIDKSIQTESTLVVVGGRRGGVWEATANGFPFGVNIFWKKIVVKVAQL